MRTVFFDGTNLTTIEGLTITHILNNATPRIALAKSRYKFTDGSAIQQHTYDNKIITVKGVFKGDRDVFDGGRAALESLFYGKLDKLLQYTDDGELLTYNAQLSNMQIKEPKGGFAEVTKLFETNTPFYTKGSEQTVSGTVNGGVDVSLGAVGGNVDALPTITIDINTWSGSGSDDTQTIVVDWLYGFCNVIGTFAVNDQIIINIETSEVTLNGGGVLYHSDFIGLKSGVTNSINADCDVITDNYDIQVDYSKRYI